MRSYFALSPAEIAQHYVASKGDPSFLPDIATALVEDVRRYLTSHQLQHRLEDAVEIAIAAYELAKAELQQVATPEQTAWQNDIQQGIGNPADDLAMRQMDELALAGQVRAMSMPEYAASRERLGLTQDLTSFLGGND